MDAAELPKLPIDIGFYANLGRDKSDPLDSYAAEFREHDISVHQALCLHRMPQLLARGTVLAPAVVMQPCYPAELHGQCHADLARVIEGNPASQFYVAMFTCSRDQIARTMDAIGQHENTTYLLTDTAHGPSGREDVADLNDTMTRLKQQLRPQIGFFLSHYQAGFYGAAMREMREQGIKVQTSDCLCSQADALMSADAHLPPNAIVVPDFDAVECQDALAQIAQAHPDTRFFIGCSSLDSGVLGSVRERIGEHDNVVYMGGSNQDAIGLPGCVHLIDKIKGLLDELAPR